MYNPDSTKILLPEARCLRPDAFFSNTFQEHVQLIIYQYTILDLFGEIKYFSTFALLLFFESSKEVI